LDKRESEEKGKKGHCKQILALATFNTIQDHMKGGQRGSCQEKKREKGERVPFPELLSIYHSEFSYRKRGGENQKADLVDEEQSRKLLYSVAAPRTSPDVLDWGGKRKKFQKKRRGT